MLGREEIAAKFYRENQFKYRRHHTLSIPKKISTKIAQKINGR